MTPRWTTIGLMSLLLLLSASCSRDRINPDENQNVDLEQIQQDMGGQLVYHGDLTALAGAIDTTAAMDSVVSLLSADPKVQWARNAGTQINILWRSGLRGFLLLRAGGSKASRVRGPHLAGLIGEAGSPSPITADVSAGATVYTVPANRKALFLAPCYSEFKFWDDDFLTGANVDLPTAGYEPFTVYKENEVTLERLTSMDTGGYGIIRLSSHGAAYPDTSTIQEVYFLSGEVQNEATDQANAAALKNGLLGITSYYGENRYSFCSQYFWDKVDFGDSNPMVMIGCCFGYLGTWGSDLRTRAKAGAVLGWDWEIDARIDAPRMRYMLDDLCDMSPAKPKTLQTYYRSITPYYMEGQRQITLHYAAADSFALWMPSELTITQIDPPRGAAGDYVFVSGSGFGTTPGTVRFGTAPSNTFGYWHDNTISVQVPEGLQGGPLMVTVVAGGKTSNPVEFFYEDELFSRLHGAWYMDFFLVSDHKFEPWDAGSDQIFAHLLQPITWDGTQFSGEAKESSETVRRRLLFSGSVGSDGRTLNLEYEFGDTTITVEGRYETYKKARITGLPFDDFYGGTTHYQTESGPAVEGHVLELVWRRRGYSHGGGVIEIGDYLSTDWGTTPESNRLQVIFH